MWQHYDVSCMHPSSISQQNLLTGLPAGTISTGVEVWRKRLVLSLTINCMQTSLSVVCRTRANKVVAFAILLVGIAAASFALLGGVLLLLGGLPKRA